MPSCFGCRRKNIRGEVTIMKDKTITIAILDDGVDFDKLSITGSEYFIVPYELELASKNNISHGTVCTYIIKEYIKKTTA